MNNICFITHQFKTGGVEKVFLTLSKGMLEFDQSLAPVYSDFDSIIKQISPNVNQIRWEKYSYFQFIFQLKRKFLRLSGLIDTLIVLSEILFFRFNPRYKNYLFINFSDTLSSLIIAYLGARKKRISWIHLNPRVIERSPIFSIYRYLYGKMDCIVCICNSQKSILLEVMPELEKKHIEVVYNPILASQIEAQKTMLLDESIHFRYVLMTARFDNRSKDFLTLIAAYTKLLEEHDIQEHLVLVGDGIDWQDTADLVENLGLTHRIHLVGQDDNPYRWMSRAECFVLSSKSEGLGVVIVEAMQSGTPVIASDCVTGPREVLKDGECGILFPVGDVAALKTAMWTLLQNKQLKQHYIEKGYIRARDFHSEVILEQCARLFKQYIS